jgi:succinoglycan biosynthesis transport protein ExoP
LGGSNLSQIQYIFWAYFIFMEKTIREDHPAHSALMLDGDDDGVDIRARLRVILHYKWSILTLAVVVAMLATLVALSMQPVYRASALLMIEQKRSGSSSGGIEEVWGNYLSRDEYLATQIQLLTGRELLERVVLANKIADLPEFRPKEKSRPIFDWKGVLAGLLEKLPVEKLLSNLPIFGPDDIAAVTPLISEVSESEKVRRVVNRLSSRVSVSPVKGTQLVKISVTMSDPLAAANTANALIRGYIEGQLEARMKMSETANEWMNDRVAELRAKLQESERELQSYREEQNLVVIGGGGVSTLSTDEIGLLVNRLAEARKKRAELQNQFEQVNSIRRSDIERVASIPAVLSNPMVQQFNALQAQAKSRIQELTRRYGPKHPAMIAAEEDFRSAMANLRAQVVIVIASIEKGHQLALANEKALQLEYEASKGEIQLITRKGFKLRELEQEVESNKALFDSYLGRLKEASASYNMEVVNARMVESALVPKGPVRPDRKMIVLVSVFMSLIGGAALTLLLDSWGNTFKSANQVEKILNLPVVGNTPLVKIRKPRDVATLFLSKKEKGFGEAIRGIRTSVVLANSGLAQSQSVLMVTSSIPGEGKSVLASNLALSLSQLKSTILIDADMRRPSVAKNFGLRPGTLGLAELLAGNARLEECLQDQGSLQILAAGHEPSNPLELLSSDRFDKLIEVLRTKFDYIILDVPPLQAVSDPLFLAFHADQLLYVVKYDSTKIDQVKAGIDQLRQNNWRVHGVVLSQMDFKKANAHSYYYSGAYENYYV